MTTASLQPVVGNKIVRARRIFYEFGGGVSSGAGPFELSLDDGTVMLFDAAGDGEGLTVVSRAWVDPFREPLSEQNRQFVRDSGKWTAFDVPADSPLGELAGRPIVGIEEVTSRFGSKVAGVVIAFATAELRVVVESDELWVSVESGRR